MSEYQLLSTTRRLSGLLAATLLAAAVGAQSVLAGAASTSSLPDLKAIGWQSLGYSRTNLWASASSRIVLQELPASAMTDGDLPAEARSPDGGRVLLLLAENQAAANRERQAIWYDPVRATLLQRCRVAYGRNDRRAKCYVYRAEGVWRERRESEGDGGEADADWVQGGAANATIPDWKVSSRGRLKYPAAWPADAGLASPLMLLPLASAAPLEKAGDGQAVFVHTDQDFFRVRLRMQGREQVEVDYQREAVDGARRRVAGRVTALVVDVEASPLGTPKDGFTLLGLAPPLQILLDAETRAPLALRGHAPWLGETELRLDSVRLAR